MPFGRGLAPSMLYRPAEAVARMSWCVDQHALGVITGRSAPGKSPSAPQPPRGDPTDTWSSTCRSRRWGCGGYLHHIGSRPGAEFPHRDACVAGRRIVGSRIRRAGPHPRGGESTSRICLSTRTWKRSAMLTNHDLDSGRRRWHSIAARSARRVGSADRGALCAGREESAGFGGLHHPSLQFAGRTDPLVSDEAVT